MKAVGHTLYDFDLVIHPLQFGTVYGVIAVVDDEWRSQLYDLQTSGEIAKHIAYNLFFNGFSLSELDGWADQPNERARIIDDDIEFYRVTETIKRV